jgi:hypothetical protein
MAWHIASMTGSTVMGFLLGLFTFRLKQRWCRTCGATLTCPDPTYHPSTERTCRDDARRNAAPENTRRPASRPPNRHPVAPVTTTGHTLDRRPVDPASGP